MITKELEININETKLPKWFSLVKVNINVPHFNIELKGLNAIHLFLSQQISGWEKYESLPKKLLDLKNEFKSLKSGTEHFFKECQYESNEKSLSSYWTSSIAHKFKGKSFFCYDSPQVKFLLKINKERPDFFEGAYQFMIGSDSININNKSSLIGAFLAYDFEVKDFLKSPNKEAKEMGFKNKLIKKLEKYIDKNEIEIIEDITKFENLVNKTEKPKEPEESSFDEWFEGLKKDFSDFDSNSKAKISLLEKTYEELLKLKKPAEYWKSRARTLKNEGWRAIDWLVAVVVFTCINLYGLLWLTSEGMLLSFVKGNAQAIKWSIIFVIFISFAAYGVGVLSKVAFSSFHLARDAEEKEQLTYVYLALIKDKLVDEKDKNFIIQSLFSRADTGLLRNNSKSEIANYFLGKKPKR